jgi:hypothetical protein
MQAAYESPGPGGTLHWKERSDRHWTARGLGGYFDAAPIDRGYHLYWMSDGGGYEDLGAHATLGGVFGTARSFADERATGRKAAENPAGGDCAHTHPPEVPTSPCDPATGPLVIEKVEVSGSQTTAVVGEDKAALRWADVSFDKAEDASRFAKLLEKVNSTIVANHMGLIVTTNATGPDIVKTLAKHKWKAGYRLSSAVPKYDLAAEQSGLEPFASWPDVLAYARAGAPLYYHAPLDHRAVLLVKYEVRARTIRVWPIGSTGRGRFRTSDPFTADGSHLSRFRRPAGVASEKPRPKARRAKRA